VDGGSVTDQLIASGAGTISDLDLFLDVTHGYVGDLIVTLENAIAGKSVEVINEPGYPASEYGCTGADINATLDDEGSSPVEDACNTSGTAISGTFTPDNPLSAFDGLAFDGTWKLTVADPYTEYSGNLVKWCLRATVSSSSTTNDNCSTGKLPLTSGFSSGSTERYSETEIVTSGTVAITGTGTLVTLEAPKIVLSGGFSVENGAGLVAKAKAVDCSAL
jgi:subtilisin-like proprotein convertase family protein